MVDCRCLRQAWAWSAVPDGMRSSHAQEPLQLGRELKKTITLTMPTPLLGHTLTWLGWVSTVIEYMRFYFLHFHQTEQKSQLTTNEYLPDPRPGHMAGTVNPALKKKKNTKTRNIEFHIATTAFPIFFS